MKKTTPTNANARRFNIVPTFSTVDNLKISPKNSSYPYFSRNPKAAQSNVGRNESISKTQNSYQTASSLSYGGSNSFVSNSGLASGSTSIPMGQNQQIKSPRMLQSPVQKSPSYYPHKERLSENNVLKDITNQIKMSHSPLSLENNNCNTNHKTNNSEQYPITLSIHFNGERRQSTTPKPKDTKKSTLCHPGYRGNFSSGAYFLKSSKEFDPTNLSGSLTEIMKPDAEPFSANFSRLDTETSKCDDRRRVITSESLDEESFKERSIQSKSFINAQNFAFNGKGCYCIRHVDKKSKYFYQDENDSEKIEYYCSKCAVELALKGIKVTEIPGTVPSNQRSLEFESRNSTKLMLNASSPHGRDSQRSSQETDAFAYQNESKRLENLRSSIETKRRNDELSSFVNRLEDLLERMRSLENCVNHEKTKAVNNFQTDKANILWLSSQLIDKITEQKEALCKSLDNEQSQMVLILADIAKTPLKYLTEISQIKCDIEENMQNIMKNIEDKPYKRIMEKYEERLALYDSYLRDKEIAVVKEMIQPKSHNTLESLKLSLSESLREILESSMPTQEKKDLLNLGDFEGFMRCDEEMLEIPQTSAQKFNPAAQHRKVSSMVTNRNYALISFENKDIFQNAMNTSKDIEILEENSTCETVIEHEEEHISVHNSQNLEEPSLQGQDISSSEICPKEQPQLNNKKATANRRNRYQEPQKKENFEVLVVPSNQNKQINEAFLNFIESKINAESSSPKGNYQKSLFTSPNFKEIYEHDI